MKRWLFYGDYYLIFLKDIYKNKGLKLNNLYDFSHQGLYNFLKDIFKEESKIMTQEEFYDSIEKNENLWDFLNEGKLIYLFFKSENCSNQRIKDLIKQNILGNEFDSWIKKEDFELEKVFVFIFKLWVKRSYEVIYEFQKKESDKNVKYDFYLTTNLFLRDFFKYDLIYLEKKSTYSEEGFNHIFDIADGWHQSLKEIIFKKLDELSGSIKLNFYFEIKWKIIKNHLKKEIENFIYEIKSKNTKIENIKDQLIWI